MTESLLCRTVGLSHYCERLPDQAQHILLAEIAKRGSQKVRPAEEQGAKAI
jgi:hypothetical protein